MRPVRQKAASKDRVAIRHRNVNAFERHRVGARHGVDAALGGECQEKTGIIEFPPNLRCRFAARKGEDGGGWANVGPQILQGADGLARGFVGRHPVHERMGPRVSPQVDACSGQRSKLAPSKDGG